jgi:hypothetical protein
LSDFVDCEISNLRLCNSGWGSTPPPGTMLEPSKIAHSKGLDVFCA